MACVTEYGCMDCGLELADDGRVFIWESESNQTIDFLILMSTYQLLDDAEITGNVSETYCSKCDRFLKIYSITEFQDGIANPCELVEEGIKNYIGNLASELIELKEIKKRASCNLKDENGYFVVEVPQWDFRHGKMKVVKSIRKKFSEEELKEFHEEIDEYIEIREENYRRYLNSNYLVVDESDRPRDDYNPLEKVNCPGCGSEVYRYVNGEVPCPKCGGELIAMSCINYD